MTRSACLGIGIVLWGLSGPTAAVALAAEATPPEWIAFESDEIGLAFRHPASLSVTVEPDGWARLTHAVAFRHHDPCDFRDEVVTLDAVTDFDLELQVFEGTLHAAVTAHETGSVSAHLDGNRLLPESGFIDEVTVGTFEGYRVTSGTHGCGRRMYFLVADPERTVVARWLLVGELSESYRRKEEVLDLPGLIGEVEAEGLFERVLQSLRVFGTKDPAQEARSDPSVGPYFGQSPPGTTPEVFAPGIVSLDDRYEYVIDFSPDGKECCFGVTDDRWSTCDLYSSRREQGAWSTPAPADFQQGPDGWLPFFTRDGKRLLFSSGRPDMENANTYVCEKSPRGWGAPRKMGAPVNSPTFDWRPTATSTGTLYFASDRDGEQGEFDIYRSVPVDGNYETVERLESPVNSPSLEASPWISPDEDYLTIESWRPGGYGKADLYICYRKSDGSWTSPQNLGPSINTEQIEDGGSVSPDGRFFFFNRREDWVTKQQTDIYWVDMRAIFKPYVLNPVGEMSAEVGKDFSLQLPADEFADHDDDRLGFSARTAGGGPLPAWLTFDPQTRTLSGSPDKAGGFRIEIQAADPLGSTGLDVVTIHCDR